MSSRAPSQIPKITIAGAGLVGSLLACVLRRIGYAVTVFEKRADPRAQVAQAGRSINLILTSRGLHALSQVGLSQAAKDLSVAVYGREIHSKSPSGSVQYQPYGRDGECNFAISRAELNCFLIDQAEKAGAILRFNSEIEKVEVQDRKLSAGGATEPYDILIGTDGVNSAVRKAICETPSDSPIAQMDWLEADYKELLLPSTNASGLRTDALHIWPHGTHMLMALANRDGSFTLTLYLPRESQQDPLASFSGCKTESQVRELFERDFSDIPSRVPDYVSQFLNHPQGRLGTLRLSSWQSHGHTMVLGDAAHAIVPFFGQGMNCGFEDVTELINLLGKTPVGLQRWQELLPTYEKQRKPNADAIADMALENYVEMRDHVGDPAFHETKRIEAWLEDKLPLRYKSRYRLITYSLVPYRRAQEIGRLQRELLQRLTSSTPRGTMPDYSLAEQLLSEFESKGLHA